MNKTRKNQKIFFARKSRKIKNLENLKTKKNKTKKFLHWQVSRIFIDEKNSNSTSFLIEWEAPPPPPGIALEYLPSYSIVGRNGSQWHNTTWLPETDMRLSNLTAFTLYNITVYVRDNRSSTVHPPSIYIGAQTNMGAPSSPWNVTVKQTSHSEIQIRWNPPVKPNGLITTFRVFVEPTAPPLMVSVSANTYQALVAYKFVPGTNYTFQVAAENRYTVSNKSAPTWLVFDGSAVIAAVSDLKVVNIDNSTAQLSWTGVVNASAYTVLVRTSNFYAQVKSNLFFKNSKIGN